ncbi:NT5C3B isoform 5 [Pongo abelii]|uniref:NT5C3B isoform 5 n=1 Tax=Pongo abelii TaxID=9601 RepID=A0A2J8RFC8_PONAB|nr:NT5C3B isoform 5 [Pongo abelii]
MAEEVRREKRPEWGGPGLRPPGRFEPPSGSPRHRRSTQASEHPDEGHSPDAAAWAGAGDRGRPPQGRRRSVTGDF